MPLAFFDDYQKKISERILSGSGEESPELPSTGETLSGEEMQSPLRSLAGQKTTAPEKGQLSPQ